MCKFTGNLTLQTRTQLAIVELTLLWATIFGSNRCGGDIKNGKWGLDQRRKKCICYVTDIIGSGGYSTYYFKSNTLLILIVRLNVF